MTTEVDEGAEQITDHWKSSGWSKGRTARFLAIGTCWLNSLIYLLGGTAFHLLVAVSFVVSAVGQLKRYRWGENAAITTAVVVSLFELSALLTTPVMWTANLVRFGLQVLVVYLILASRIDESDGGRSPNHEMRGTV